MRCLGWLIVNVWLCSTCYAAQASIYFVDAVGLTKPQTANTVQAQTFQHILRQLHDHYELADIQRNRARVVLASQANACSPWLKKTAERQQQYHFSLPYMFEPGLQLVALKGSAADQRLAALRDNKGAVSLRQLLVQPRPLLLGIEINRSYGDELTTILQAFATKLYQRTSSSAEPGAMLPMLEKQFVDVVIEYPSITHTVQTPLALYNIAEAAPYNAVYLLCNKSATGAANIERLDKAIQHLARDARYQQLVLSNLPAALHAQVMASWHQALGLAASQ